MTARRKAAAAAVVGAPLLVTALTATPASAHGSMENPVSRVLSCYGEGPENPTSAACKAAVAAGGKQALYDWNAVRLGNANGQSQKIIPDGKLCSAGVDEFKGLDLARADWPATQMTSGSFTFKYKETAAHLGTFSLYITKPGYDPTKPLKWSDLESQPFATATNPPVQNGSYVFKGTVPQRTGRQLIYSIWQRSDSPEAFYTCSDVVFGQGSGGSGSGTSPAPTASAPSDSQIAAGASKSSMGPMPGMSSASPTGSPTTGSPTTGASLADSSSTGQPAANQPAVDGSSTPLNGKNLAETGGSSSTTPLAIGGAAVVAAGVSLLLVASRRRVITGRHRS